MKKLKISIKKRKPPPRKQSSYEKALEKAYTRDPDTIMDRIYKGTVSRKGMT